MVGSVAKDYSAIGRLYAQQVVAGKIPAGQIVRLACQRQLDDLKRKKWKYTFDTERGNRVCRFIERLRHVKGQWNSKTITLEPWQCFLLTVLFGWIDSQGFRRFRKAYIEVPRKNSKTTLCAGVALFMLCADGEIGPEVYSAAVSKDQARISWEIGQLQVSADREMQRHFGVRPLAHKIVAEKTGGFFRPLSRDADSLEGLNPHCAVVDELHAHKTREVFDVLNQAMGSRRQPLLLSITTAGDNKTGIAYEQHDYVEQILSGRHEDDRYFGIIYTIDPADDWTAPEAAMKANPNYGVSVIPEDINTLCAQAQRSADSQNTFLTKRLNVWVTVGAAYFNMLAYRNRCKSELTLEDFRGQKCVGCLDLASKTDIAAKVLLFPRGNHIHMFGKYYLPADCLERGKPNYDFYAGWAKKGLLTLTEGEIIDFEVIEDDLLQDQKNFRMTEVCYDQAKATELSTRMKKEGLNMVEVPSNVRNFSEPMKHMEALILAGRIHHDGDPVLDWMVGNVHAKPDHKDGVFPRKPRYDSKIDGAVAAIMGIGRLIVMVDQRRPLCFSQGVL